MAYTIFSPILADSFGMNVKEISYYFIGIMVALGLGSIAV